MKHLKRFNEEFGRDEVVFTSQRNPRLVITVSISPDRRISNIDNKTGIRFPFSVGQPINRTMEVWASNNNFLMYGKDVGPEKKVFGVRASDVPQGHEGDQSIQTNLDSMKHLKRFNENAEEDLDIEYIKHCFADLSDDSECRLEYEANDKNDPHFEEKYAEFVDISIDVPRLTKGGSIEKMVENSERIALVVKSVDIAVKRLKDEYPSYKINIDYEEDEDMPNDYFMINITK